MSEAGHPWPWCCHSQEQLEKKQDSELTHFTLWTTSIVGQQSSTSQGWTCPSFLRML